ncbi:Txe/YoeB family addiction module toxin [Rickettsia endosymbiont of Polydrusus tereticollis]|uniref:Txe/YoeB family addiction module toxin n=1 Tax=Rickettsia endosymbiont of Polydrusus tereticollis TaxID=3066251 RepID=UPI003132EB60
MKVIWSDEALKQLEFWKRNNPQIIKRIQLLIDNIILTPCIGKGKPEPLKYDLSGFWSRRIDQEHRLVYSFNKKTQIIEIESCKGHY